MRPAADDAAQTDRPAGRRLAGGLGELGELAFAFEKHRPCHIASIAGNLTRDHGSVDLIIHQTGSVVLVTMAVTVS